MILFKRPVIHHTTFQDQVFHSAIIIPALLMPSKWKLWEWDNLQQYNLHNKFQLTYMTYLQ
jgi:hypothetical protein